MSRPKPMLKAVLLATSALFAAVPSYTSGAIINVAPAGVASQSSTRAAGGAASRATDTQTTGHWSRATNTHTNTAAAGQFWEVAFGPNAVGLELQNITVFGRGDCCQNRLRDFTLDVFDSSNSLLYTQNYTNAPGIPASNGSQTFPAQGAQFTPPAGMFNADRVRITTNINDVFSLAEVQVNADNANIKVGRSGVIGTTELDGTLTDSTNLANARVVRVVQNRDREVLNMAEVQVLDSSNTNIAPAGTASQSTSHGAGPAGNGNDNNFGNFSHTLYTTIAGGDEYWQVDLTGNSTLKEITVFDRVGCCGQDRSADIQVQVFSDAAATNQIFAQDLTGITDGASGSLTFFDRSVATLDPAGNYTFEIDADTLTSDTLEVALGSALGSTELVAAGTLNIELLGDNPNYGDTFQLLLADDFSGAFSEINLPSPAYLWDTSNLLVDGTITYVPEPNNILIWSLVGLSLLLFGHRRRA